MPNAVKTLALLFMLLTFAAVAHAKDDGHDKDRAVLAADYQEYDTAAHNKDADGCVQFCTDDYTVTDAKGTIQNHSKAEALAWWKKMLPHTKTIVSRTVITHIAFAKGGASVMTRNDSTIIMAAHGAAHTYRDTATSRNDWVQSGNIWKLKHTVFLSDVTTKDGKPVK